MQSNEYVNFFLLSIIDPPCSTGKLMIPKQVLGPESLLVTIAVDNRDSFCSDTFLYLADVTSFKLIVYDVRKGRVWRVGSDYFYPFPMDGRFNINGVPFNLMDGILALALGEYTTCMTKDSVLSFKIIRFFISK